MFYKCGDRRRWPRGVGVAILSGVLAMPIFGVAAPITVAGISDRNTYTKSATFTVAAQGGYGYAAWLNAQPVSIGTPVTITRADYYELEAWRTNQAAPFDVTNLLVRFIVQSDRGNPEKGLIKWTPYPLIPSTTSELAGARLQVTTPAVFPSGLPIPVVAWVDDTGGRERRVNGIVSAPGFAAHDIPIRRGVGSGFLPPATSAGILSYDARLLSLSDPRTISIESNTVWTAVSGLLAGAVIWPENSRIFLSGNLTVPANGLLTIGAGTIIKLNPLVNLTNSGRLVINGTAERPVVFTSTNLVYPEVHSGAWGGFILRGATAQILANHAVFTGGAGAASFDFAPGNAHRSEQALFLLQNGALAALTNCYAFNLAGQFGNGYNADLILDHSLVQRAITAGEYVGGTITVNHSALIEFPADTDQISTADADADYDAIYFTTGTHIVRDSLIGFALDDAIDSGSGGAGTVVVTNCWIESALHEANAWSGEARRTWTYDTVLINCGQGFECGWSTGDNSPLCFGERILSTANSVGARIGDNYDWSYNGFLTLTNSLILHNYRDLFLKTWNAPDTGWDTNSWVDRLQQADIRDNYLTAADPRFPDNQVWNPARDGERLAAWMTTPPEAPVGIGLAVRTNRFDLALITNGVPVRLSSFTTHDVAVDYVILGRNGSVAAGTLAFAPGETVKQIPPVWPSTNDLALEVVLLNPVLGELTGQAQAWFFAPPPAQSQSATLIAPGSRWNYLDTGGDPGIAWRSLGYDDSAWSNNIAQLGFGDDDEQTKIRQVGTNGQKSITFYFRQTFLASNSIPFTQLSLWLLRDDGGVVYLNGSEVYRSSSLPPLPAIITSQTLATNLPGGAAPPDNTIDTALLSAELLQTGTNLIAVEIHQQAASGSDVSFDFGLTGNVFTDTDSDGDDMPDGWEQDHGLNPLANDAQDDPDGDGMVNLWEYLAGTNPQDKTSCLRIERVTPPTAGGDYAEVTFQAVAGKTYSVQTADSLTPASWRTVTNLTATATNLVITVTDPSSKLTQPRFYRLRTPAAP